MTYYGINLRDTAVHPSATDGANDTYWHAAGAENAFTAVRGAFTNGFGKDSGLSWSGANRSGTGVDARLAGLIFNGGLNSGFAVKLPSGAGQYRVRMAFGDRLAARSGMSWVIRDGSSSGSILHSRSSVDTGAADSFADTNGTIHTAANWPANNTVATLTFATDTAYFEIGANAFWCHVAFEAVAAAPVLSSPTTVSTGSTIATVRVTTDTAPSGSSTLAVQVLPAADAVPSAATILASPTLTITSGASGARDFNLTGLTNGTAYRAHFAQTGPSNVVSTSSFTPSTVPGAPTIGTAVAGNASATVNGTAPASNGGSAITGYRSTATPGGSTVTGASLPITHTGLTNGTAYTFTLAAQNANGYGAESAASNSVTPSAGSPPPPPPPPPPGSATLTLTGFKQWTGTAWTSITVPFVKVCRASTGAVVLEVSSAAVNASGNMTITSGSLTAGVVYVVFGFNTDGTRSFKKTVTAA